MWFKGIAIIYTAYGCFFEDTFQLIDMSLIQGNPVGQTGLGMLYMYGKGVDKVKIAIM